MPYDREHMLFSWEGDIFGSSFSDVIDNFAGSFRFADVGTGGDLSAYETDEQFGALAQVFQSHVTDGVLYLSGHCRFRTLKWNRIGKDGRYVRDSTRRLDVGFNSPGAARYPTQVACVSTWLTEKQRGLASKGRTYWPTIAAVNESGLLSGTEARRLANAYGTLVMQMNNAIDGTIRASVMSKQKTGATQAITGVQVGDRLDVQQRRRTKGKEFYQGGFFSQFPLA